MNKLKFEEMLINSDKFKRKIGYSSFGWAVRFRGKVYKHVVYTPTETFSQELVEQMLDLLSSNRDQTMLEVIQKQSGMSWEDFAKSSFMTLNENLPIRVVYENTIVKVLSRFKNVS